MTHLWSRYRAVIFRACDPCWAENDNTPSAYVQLQAQLRLVFGAVS